MIVDKKNRMKPNPEGVSRFYQNNIIPSGFDDDFGNFL